ncbi:MAG TPA: hypothetical protein VKC66_04375 [Xanthobacteraceae bacterium]|jgi:DNA-nicking Smr family endonuclease|nr:hypothetical protein [Xanthobacteraceae bacterium]
MEPGEWARKALDIIESETRDLVPSGAPTRKSETEVAFRQLQRLRLAALSKAEFLDLFGLWRDHYRARLAAKESERRERLAQLWEERAACLIECVSLPPQQRALPRRRA